MRLLSAPRLAPTLVLLLLACGDGPVAPEGTDPVLAEASSDRATFTSRDRLELSPPVSCANGGAGEVVHVEGSFLRTIHVWTDGRGRTRVKQLTNPQNVRGIGLTSGNLYVGAGMTQTAGGTWGTSLTNNFLLIGQGRVGDLKVHEVLRILQDREGNPEVVVDRYRITCR